MQSTITKEHRTAEDEIRQDIENFLAAGGQVAEIPTGVSAVDTTKGVRFCVGCRVMRPPSDFEKTGKNGCNFTCKTCVKNKTKPHKAD